VLGRYRETIFDPGLLDLVRVTVAGDDLRARILADRPVALLVDPDPEETTVLELRLIEQGFEVRVARSADQARKILEADEIELVVSEIELGASGEDGLALLAAARRNDWGRELPWLILSRRQGRADAETAFGLGVIDYMLKPAPAEVLVAKLKQQLDKRAGDRPQRGVSGSLSEMGIPDLVQILFYGRKSGALRLRRGAESGDVYFAEGMVVDAVWGKLRGEDAFYDLLRLREGDFAFDPAGRAEKTTITASPETLLLEGMRRMDEG
jgi:DNA-binding response OmpR family regulator